MKPNNKTVFFYLALAGFLLGNWGCIVEPNFSNEPRIEFVRIINRANTLSAQNVVDMVTITVAYTDGDGDLGLSEADVLLPEFRPIILNELGEEVQNPFNNNYFLTYFRQEGEEFVEMTLQNPGLSNGRFERLSNGGSAISGEINYVFELPLIPGVFTQGTVLRFEVQIADRARNLSNIVTTDPITIGQNKLQ